MGKKSLGQNQGRTESLPDCFASALIASTSISFHGSLLTPDRSNKDHWRYLRAGHNFSLWHLALSRSLRTLPQPPRQQIQKQTHIRHHSDRLERATIAQFRNHGGGGINPDQGHPRRAHNSQRHRIPPRPKDHVSGWAL